MHREHLHGSAQWANIAALDNAGLHKPLGLHIGLGPNGKPLYLAGDAPLLTMAGSGSGKGTSIITPAILDWSGPLFVLDPKGENASLTLHHQHKLGKVAYCINPWGLLEGAPWFLPKHAINPFSVLKRNSPFLVADCNLLMQTIIPETGAGDEYWSLKPRELGFAILLWQISKFGSITASKLHKLLSAIFADPDTWDDIVRDLRVFPDEEVRRIIGEIEQKRSKAGAEFSGIMGTLFKALSFISDPALSGCLRGGDFTFDVLTQEDPPATVYLIVPGDYMGLYAGFMRLMIGVAMLVKRRAPQARGVVFLIDEAAQLGVFDMLRLAFSYARGGGVRTWAFFQSIGQIEGLYGRSGAQAFLESAQMRQFFGIGHIDTAHTVSTMLGNQTVFYDDPLFQTQHRQQALQHLLYGGFTQQALHTAFDHLTSANLKSIASRPLMSPDEVLRLGSDQHICFISSKNLNPILGLRLPYFLRPDLAGAYLPNPDHPPYDQVPILNPKGKPQTLPVWSHEVLPKLAHLPQYQQGMMSYASPKPHKNDFEGPRRLLKWFGIPTQPKPLKALPPPS